MKRARRRDKRAALRRPRSQPKGTQPAAVQASPVAQHSHVGKQTVCPAAQASGSQRPSTHDSQSPQLSTHALGSHA